ncbi:uncharacterized protein [Euphorbia lathyris]|uniref:uncharacterized protein n=1 Tax=Euphorbia lathyris TaxID=212925 RepID=UPI003313960D
MNRSSVRESLIGARNFPVASSHSHNHRRGHSLNAFSKDTDENLDLFSKNRRSLSVASSDDSSDVSAKLGRLSVGSVKPAKSGIDDLLSSAGGGKHDYDWLLTPPGTPLFPSSDACESQPTMVAPRSSSLSRSISTTKASRLSVSQSESHHSTRPSRSSSVTRTSVSSSQFSSYSSNRSTSILNTSSASVSSYIRPSSPVARSSSTARPSAPSSRPTVARPSTPSRARPAPNNSLNDKTRPSQSSRPSTPTSRAQISSSLNLSATRSNSRPSTPTSTPTRRNSAPSTLPSSGASTSAGRIPSNGRIPGPPSRPSSPGPRFRAPQQPVIPPDFSLDTPPNLRTTLPDRPLSAGRSRPGAAKANSETTGPMNVPRRHSSPTVSRGRLNEAPAKSRASNGHAADASDSRKVPNLSDMGMRKPIRSLSTTSESNGLGRTISKKSLDMAIRHMDIKNGTGGNRALSSTSLFPQSVRSASKTQSVRSMSAPESINNGEILENGYHSNRSADTGMEVNDGRYSGKLSEVDIYESSRYDAILLKEDSRNTNWLHSIDDKSDIGPIFDNGFEPLPEPFAPL